MLGQIKWLPPDVEARHVTYPRYLHRLCRIHHLEDIAAFHPEIVTRSGDLARLAASGVVVHLADSDQPFQPLLGNRL